MRTCSVRSTRRMRLYQASLLALLFVSVAAFGQSSQPLTERLSQTQHRVFEGLSQANHVFGYRFRVLRPGRIEQLGGFFAGSKTVIVVDDQNTILARAVVEGQGSRFVWSPLQQALPVNAGQILRVLVRTGTSQTSAAAWSLAMPFTSGDIEVLALEQGWSPDTEPEQWVSSVQTLGEQHARGLVDIRFSTAAETDAPTDPVDPQPPVSPLPPVQPPVTTDPYPATAGVIDSFGQAAPQPPLGMGFMAVSAYYRDFPRLPGECSMEIHNRYWVKDANGVTHPTWHPPVDPVTGCRFAHEHGDDPRLSDNYEFAGGVAFGVTHGRAGGTMRHEDHVGHKIVVQNNWGLVAGNPQNGSFPATDIISPTGITCDWLSKLHQGSWSRDALANNAHEYQLNVRCTDGVNLRLKQLVTFGPPELVTNLCKNPSVDQSSALSFPDNTGQAFPSGISATSGVPVTKALDGKREFSCINNLMGKGQLEELWKSDGVIEFPAGGFIQFSPYYVVLNPARYIDHQWVQRGASDAYVASLDFCFDDNRSYRGVPAAFCRDVPDALQNLSSKDRQSDPRSPMNGTRRVIHPKSLVIYTAAEPGVDATIIFCTDRLGRLPRIAGVGECTEDELEQLVSRSDRRQWGWNGSDVNAVFANGTLRGAGYLNEWIRDFNAPGIRFPN